MRAASHYSGEIVGAVKLQSGHNTEPITQRVGKHAGSSGSAHQGKWLKVQFHATRGRSLTNKNIDLKIFHRRVEYFFYHRRKSVNLINKENVVFFKVGE